MKKAKLTSQQKKDQLLIAVLVIVAVLLLVFCVKASKNEPEISGQPVAGTTTSAPAVITTAAPVTTTTAPAPVTTMPQEVVTQAPSAVTTTQAPAVDETQEILEVITKGVMSLKASDASFRGHKVQNIDMKLTDSSMPSMNDFVNGILGVFIKEEVYDYDFTNGVAVDSENGGETKSNSIFPPGDCDFRLTKDGIAKATKEKDGDNTVYTVVIVPESSTLENPRPPHHNAAADTLDLSGIEIPIATITKADFEYPGATISVTLNSAGQVVGYYERLPIKGTGEAKALGLTGYGTIDGYLEENWDIEWK